MSSLLSTDNEFGIPSLLPQWQATEILTPVIGWGTISRLHSMPGTYHCYVSDHKFSRLLSAPEGLFCSGCAVACEPNASIYDWTPRYEAIAAIGRKRAAAARWGQEGVRILVDLNVPARFERENLMGVPRGWRAYSTRGYMSRPDDLAREYQAATERAGGIPLLLVVGGGQVIRELCQSLPGTIQVMSELGSETMRRACMQLDEGSGNEP